MCTRASPAAGHRAHQEVAAQGCHFGDVLADSLYGESSEFASALRCLGLAFVVTIRSNHPAWTFPSERVRRTRRRPFERVFTDGSREQRFIREIVFGQRRPTRFFEITTEPATLPPETTWGVGAGRQARPHPWPRKARGKQDTRTPLST